MYIVLNDDRSTRGLFHTVLPYDCQIANEITDEHR